MLLNIMIYCMLIRTLYIKKEFFDQMDSLGLRFIITIVVAVACGLAAIRFKVPVGGMVGGMFGVAAFNILTGWAFAPEWLKMITQTLSGAYIGMRIRKSDLPQMRVVLLPAIMMLSTFLTFNIGMGLLISKFSNLSLITALLSTTPGGIAEISLMSVDMGANQTQVALMHLMRLLTVVGVFPILLKQIVSRFGQKTESSNGTNTGDLDSGEGAENSLWITIAVSFAGGILGYISGIPAGALALSMIAVAAYNVKTDRAGIPFKYRSYVQMLAGLVIGKGVTQADLFGVPTVIIPAIAMIIGYFTMNIALSFAISRFTKMDYTTALFSTSPAGPSDMALLALDLGGDAPKVACMQMARLLSSIIIFPIAIQFVVKLFG